MAVKLSAILWVLGMVGVVSLWWINFPIPAHASLQAPLWVIKLFSLIQPTVLLSIAVVLGVVLAPQVGLSAPIAEAIVARKSLRPAIRVQFLPGMIGGLVGAVLLAILQFAAKQTLPLNFIVKAEELSQGTPFLTRILYGGITEELLLRWGMMSLFVWIGWKIFAKAQGKPSAFCFIGGIILSALLFGLGHLPLAFALATPVTAAVIVYVIAANAVFGFIAGYLYWRQGLEAAMLAHVLVHVVRVAVG
uniref:Abortive infection protein n=1 Tax=Cyanothece sp. (strain PCC 7425 / ATCC 29141) TaxID=395961 RepID=B8HL48_CYAP4